MKKAISLTAILVLTILVYQFFAGFFKTSHEINYLIEKDNHKFNINERYENNKYYFSVNNNGYNYIFTIDNKFGKNKEIITDFIVTGNSNLECIYPVYKGINNNSNNTNILASKVSSNIICSDKSNIYSYESVKNKSIVINFVKELKEKGYNLLVQEDNYNNPSRIDGVEYYKEYIDEIIAMWNYRGITIINNKNSYTNEIFDFDRYENTLGITVDKYYVVPNYINNNLFEIDGFHIINLKNNEKDLVKLDFIMSDKSYINGIINNKLYIFDKNNMKQIEIDVNKKEINVISNNNVAKYYDNSWIDRNVYDFKNSEIKFNYINKEDVKEYNLNNVYQSSDSYFVYENNTMYQIYKNNLNKKIVLFYGKDLKDIKVIDNNIYYVSDNSLYRYNDKYSIKKLLTNNELKYNYKNIVNISK